LCTRWRDDADTTDGEVLLYGIGPDHYWEKLGVDHPAIGDNLTATGYTVDYNGIDRNVVTSITINGITVDLRDPDTGKPLWRGTKGAPDPAVQPVSGIPVARWKCRIGRSRFLCWF
jgi:hypothetical protein